MGAASTYRIDRLVAFGELSMKLPSLTDGQIEDILGLLAGPLFNFDVVRGYVSDEETAERIHYAIQNGG